MFNKHKNMAMADEVEFLFRLSQPREIRNFAHDMPKGQALTDFWNEVGLKYFRHRYPPDNSVEEPPRQARRYGISPPQPSPPFIAPNPLQMVNLLRLTVDCPFEDIRQDAAKIFTRLNEEGVLVPKVESPGPSYFIQASKCPRIKRMKMSQVTGGSDVSFQNTPCYDYEDDNETKGDQGLETSFHEEDSYAVIISSDLGSTVASSNDKRGRLLSEAFLSSGRIDHAIQLMAYHSDYLEVFLKTHHFLLRGDGPLPYNHRHYIAIMASARFQCGYLMELQKREFLYQGGDPKWLRGLDAAPTKLTSLYHINKMMAHRPWVLKKEDFLNLTKKAGWSLAEVVHAVVLLAHFHSLSSFIHGCGITPEVDFDKGHCFLDPGTFNVIGTGGASSPISGHSGGEPISMMSPRLPDPNPPSPASTPSPSASNKPEKTELTNSPSSTKSSPQGLLRSSTHHINSSLLSATGSEPTSARLSTSPPKPGTSEVELLMATMKNLSETSPIEDPEERKKRFETVAASDDAQEKENRLTPTGNTASALPPEVSPFLSDPEFTYEDFSKRGQTPEMHTFRIQDYSWEEQGFSLINRLYADVGIYLDEKFKVAQNMTYYTMGGRPHVDTTKFRTAVWNYIQCLYGIRHDDYDYGEVNQLLERPLKSYIKTVCCYPERVTKADYDNVMREFKHSEKVHVNLMIMEAKIQAELLYALRTIMKFIL